MRDVAASETGTTEGRVADGVQERNRKHNKTAYFLGVAMAEWQSDH